MQSALMNIFLLYIEFVIFFLHIRFALFILLAVFKTAKFIVCRIRVDFMNIYMKCMKGFECRGRGDAELNLTRYENAPAFNLSDWSNWIDGPFTITGMITDMGTVELSASMESYKATEQWHVVKDSLGNYNIGLVIEVLDSENSVAVYTDVFVSPSIFFQFPMKKAKEYLIRVAEDEECDFILALDLQHNIYGSAIPSNSIYDLSDYPLMIKTSWIHIIQRRWKKVYAEKKRRLMLRGGLKAQRQFELCGKYDDAGYYSKYCGLKGLLTPRCVE